jgi:hypothetical protein
VGKSLIEYLSQLGIRLMATIARANEKKERAKGKIFNTCS